MRRFFLLFLFSLLSAQEDMSLLDKYHDGLCAILVNTSNSIDNYFTHDDNSSLSSRTHAELVTSLAKETYADMEKDIRFRLRLDLPKIQRNLRLIFEDESSDNLLYDSTTLNNQKLEDRDYYLRLDYFSFLKKTFNTRLGGGVRFRSGHLVPYLNIHSKYELYNKNNHKSQLLNRFRYYSDGEIENNFQFDSLYTLDEDLYLTWDNNLYYSSDNAFEILFDDLSFIYLLGEKKQLDFGFSISSNVEKFQKFNVEYYYLHASFYHLFYKDWVYYELSPSVLKRRINDFKPSYRLLVNLGIYFKSE
jgi:hypothetical protein